MMLRSTCEPANASTAQHLPANAVHVWHGRVSEWSMPDSDLAATLDARERGIASRFHFAADRRRYLVAHAMLRRVLAPLAGMAPSILAFSFGPAGKPALRGSGAPQFNLSHSGDIVVVAISRTGEVGVDVEQYLPDVEGDEVATHFFSPAEQRELRALAPSRKVAGFFACWARKEAYIKATGLGVSAGLDYFDVVVDPDAAGRILADRREGANDTAWRLHALPIASGYAASVVTVASVTEVALFTFRPDANARSTGA